MPSSDAEAATALKLQGNKAFQQHDWPTAVDFYTKAIEKYDKDPSFFSNRAQVCRGPHPETLRLCDRPILGRSLTEDVLDNC